MLRSPKYTCFNLLYDVSTTDRNSVYNKSAASKRVQMLYSLLYGTRNRSSGVCACTTQKLIGVRMENA